ncbi:MAG: S-layer homology domain-containing protein [Clostridiales bacterium]|nr:S-layer homology domain-containing protein [Clostridiales bacterium]
MRNIKRSVQGFAAVFLALALFFAIVPTASAAEYRDASTPTASAAEYRGASAPTAPAAEYRGAYGSGQVTVTATASPVGGGVVTGGGTYAPGEPFTLRATPNPGWMFTGWFHSDGDYISSDRAFIGALTADWVGFPALNAEAVFTRSPNSPDDAAVFYGRSLEYKVTTMTASQQNALDKAVDVSATAAGLLLDDLCTKGILDEWHVRYLMDIIQHIEYRFYLSARYPDGSAIDNTNLITDRDSRTGKINILFSTVFFEMSEDDRVSFIIHEMFHALGHSPDVPYTTGFVHYYPARREIIGTGLNEAMTEFISKRAMQLYDSRFDFFIAVAYEPLMFIPERLFERYGDALFAYYLFNNVSRFQSDFDRYERNGWYSFVTLADAMLELNRQNDYSSANKLAPQIRAYLDSVTPSRQAVPALIRIVPVYPSGKGLSDSASPWAVPDIKEAIGFGIIPFGLLNNYQSSITRAEFCHTVIRMLMVNGRSVTDEALFVAHFGIDLMNEPFTDTTDRYIKMAYELGIVNGLGDGLFAPSDPITRQEAAAMLSRTAAVMSLTYSGYSPAEFADYGSVSAWATAPVDFVYATRVMTGVGGGLFDPHGYYTREQSYMTILRLFNMAPQTYYDSPAA